MQGGLKHIENWGGVIFLKIQKKEKICAHEVMCTDSCQSLS